MYEPSITRITTTDGSIGGMYCGMCGHKMYHDVEHNMWRCPNCHDRRD